MSKQQLIGIIIWKVMYFTILEHTVPLPHLCISTAFGGHIISYLVRDSWNFVTLANTRDDVVEEAFDKIGKSMESFLFWWASFGKFGVWKLILLIDGNYPRSRHKTLDFSFSGLKTAVLYDLAKQDAYSLENKEFLKPQDHALIRHVAASLHVCIADIFI